MQQKKTDLQEHKCTYSHMYIAVNCFIIEKTCCMHTHIRMWIGICVYVRLYECIFMADVSRCTAVCSIQRFCILYAFLASYHFRTAFFLFCSLNHCFPKYQNNGIPVWYTIYFLHDSQNYGELNKLFCDIINYFIVAFRAS